MPTYHRVIGRGTSGDPKLMWICDVTRNRERTEGCENVCREGCEITSTCYAWIRHVDHDTTRTRSRGGRRMVRTDPHITVYLSSDPRRFEYEGHLFLVYDRHHAGKVPKRMAERREMRNHRGSNPELWAYRTDRQVTFRHMLA
ncbi:hypothetical protein PVAG01_10377 [Phlyctema vagabunda]|uniref:Uncharacterized protein n=1 Tax=Phlyctema vagabunda TaxID=108571 RepID=A0ABR4P5U8_9HELO